MSALGKASFDCEENKKETTLSNEKGNKIP